MSMRALLHDHLDGGIRPSTVVDLANSLRIPLPVAADDAESLARWYHVRAGEPLEQIFARFQLSLAVMQTAAGLRRVAQEAVEDLASDGVSYAEIRFAPTQHVRAGLSLDQIVSAVLAGIGAGPIECRLILCAMRNERSTEQVADLAIRWFADGVVGVDLAGIEPGEPIGPHRNALARAKAAGLGVTVHAGEMTGPANIGEAVTGELADRVGHGFRLIEDCVLSGGQVVDMGDIASSVLHSKVPLEICITSNGALGVDAKSHPFLALARAGFLVTINTDNRTLTPCTQRSELALAKQLGATNEELQTFLNNAWLARFARSSA